MRSASSRRSRSAEIAWISCKAAESLFGLLTHANKQAKSWHSNVNHHFHSHGNYCVILRLRIRIAAIEQSAMPRYVCISITSSRLKWNEMLFSRSAWTQSLLRLKMCDKTNRFASTRSAALQWISYSLVRHIDCSRPQWNLNIIISDYITTLSKHVDRIIVSIEPNWLEKLRLRHDEKLQGFTKSQFIYCIKF